MAAVGGRALLPHSVRDLGHGAAVLRCTEAERSKAQGHVLRNQIHFL